MALAFELPAMDCVIRQLKQGRTQNFSLEGVRADPEAIYNLCLILKIVIQIMSHV